MLQDQGPGYLGRYGLANNPWNNPNKSDYDSGGDPNAGFLGKRLNGHPIMRFMVMAAGTAIGMAVAGKVAKEGGLRLADKLAEGGFSRLNPMFGEGWQRDLLHSVRNVQRVFDGWEGGVRRVIEDDLNFRGDRVERIGDSWGDTFARRQQLAARHRQGLDLDIPLPEWHFADSMRQSMVRSMRRLPYEIPAAYVAQRFVVDPMMGRQPGDRRPNWYNPIDVLGDFAQQSAKNLAFFITPIDVIPGALKNQYRSLRYAEADVFPNIRRVKLNHLLELVGHDVGNIAVGTGRLGQKSLGSFAAGIQESMVSSKSAIQVFRDAQSRAKQGLSNRDFWRQTLKDIGNVEFGGTGGFLGFGKGFARRWDEFNELFAMSDAARTPGFNPATPVKVAPKLTGRSLWDYWSNAARRMAGFGERVRPLRELPFDAAKAYVPGGNNSRIEQYVHFLQSTWSAHGGKTRSDFYLGQMKGHYKSVIRTQLRSLVGSDVIDDNTLNAIIERLQIHATPGKNPIANVNPALRIGLGEESMVGNTWHGEFRKRLTAMKGVSRPAADAITQNIEKAVQQSELYFADNFQKFDKSIRNSWDTFYNNTFLPHAFDSLGTIKPSYSQVTANTEDVNIWLRRQAARYLNHNPWNPRDARGAILPVQITADTSEAEIARRLKFWGLDPKNSDQLRGFLMERGAIRPKSTNIFGFTPLSINEALSRNYFAAKSAKDVYDLNQRLQEFDPTRSTLGKSIPVGKGVWTRGPGGSIVDLTGFPRGFRKFVDTLSANVQIPILGINPFRTLFYEAERQARSDIPIVAYMKSGSHPLLGSDGQGADAYFWFRQRGSRGRVAALRTSMGSGPYGDSSNTLIDWLQGSYRISRTDADSMAGRTLRAVIRDKGLMPNKQRSALGAFFAIDQDQRDSLFNLWRRVRGRKTDLTNPLIFSKFLLDNQDLLRSNEGGMLEKALARFAMSKMSAEELASGVTPDMGKLRTEFLEGWNAWMREAKMQPMSTQVSRGLGNTLKDSPLGEIFSREYSDPQQVYARSAEFLGRRGSARQSFFKGILERQLGREVSDQELHTMVIDRGGKYNKFWSLYQRIESVIHNQERLIPAGGSVPYFENPTPKTFQAAGMYRRLDVFKRDITKAEFFREAIARMMLQEGKGSAPQLDVVTELLNGLEKLAREQHIPVAQINQYRTVILSMQTEFLEATARNSGKINILQIREEQLRGLLNNPATNKMIRGFSEADFVQNSFRRGLRQRIGIGAYSFDGATYNPFGSDLTFVPTFGNVFNNRSKLGALASVAGFTRNTNTYSQAAMPINHFMTRLNKVFSTFHLGLDETQFASPMDYFARGLVGKRIFPFVAGGAAVMGVDRTLGGWLGPRDDRGKRVYRPFATAPLFRAGVEIEALTALAPGGQSYADRREALLRGEVPIRKGRFWPLGNTPFRGGRIQYYRPSWYRRMMSGWQYTGQLWNSPMERLAFGYDFSPLRPFDPYRFERKHYKDRPYPVAGEYFTGPWGPLTTALNMTVGKVLKPPIRMHKAEVAAGMLAYSQVGQSAAAPPMEMGPSQGVFYSTSGGRSGIAVPRFSGDILNQQILFGNMLVGSVAGKGGTGAVSGGANVAALSGGVYGSNSRRTRYQATQAISAGTLGMASGSSSRSVAKGIVRPTAAYLNRAYGQRSMEPRVGGQNRLDQQIILGSANPMSPRLIPRMPTTFGNSLKVQASQAGYEFQELFGIYGFLFGSTREALGFGNQDFSPRRPVLTTAARAYGSERSFWDLNIGGLGDTPVPLDSQYANLEVSEIVRRFISHRRRDITEVNPIPNQIRQQYPWLPGSDYFINFGQGDPYTAIPEGEIRLPGAAYERMNKLHPDATGKYGLVDQLKILGNVAPWSQQYRALLKVLSNTPLSPEAQSIVSQTRKQVAGMNRENDFSNYEWAHQDFTTKTGKITGTVPGAPNLFRTSVFGDRPVRLAGVRIDQDTANYLAKYVQPGSRVSLTYDANQSPIYARTQEQPIDVIMNVNGKNINEMLKSSGMGDPSQSNQPLDKYVKASAPMRILNQGVERLLHMNTLLNTKFFPSRSPVEDWERNNVYGSSFPQWQNPVHDYLMPMLYRATTRNPITSALVLGGAGRLFASGAYAKRVASTVGAAVGFGAGLVRTEQTLQTGQRFIPKDRKREIAIEEYADILNYVKYARLYNQYREVAISNERTDPEQVLTKAKEQAARQSRGYWRLWSRSPTGAKPPRPESTKIYQDVGPVTQQALMYHKKMTQTLYGAELGGDLMDIYMAIPKRKREHFMEFAKASKRDQNRILSTAGRLERRVYEYRWGMRVERRPDLDEYFRLHELPDQNWEGWRPDVSMDQVKIKMAQNLGLQLSGMGYYPQQIQEANLVNPSYPQFDKRSSHNEVVQKLERLMKMQGINGSVNPVSTPFAGNRIRINAGVL